VSSQPAILSLDTTADIERIQVEAWRVMSPLEKAGLVGGSLASSIGGEPRTTLDVDIVVAMAETDVDCVLAALGSEFYADAGAIRRAIHQRSSVNVIHHASAIKVDLFIGDDQSSREGAVSGPSPFFTR